MPITVRALRLYRQDFERSWEIVNADFEAAREALEAAYDENRLTFCFSEGEFEEISNRYRRLRSWLYGLLPEVEER